VEAFEQDLGRPLGADGHFHPWTGAPPDLTPEKDDLAHGRLPVMAWNFTDDVRGITAGEYDSVFTQAAVEMSAVQGQVILRWLSEMNGPWRESAGTVPSPLAFIKAWRHVVELFRAAGATNVEFAWVPSAWAWANLGRGPAYYPGNTWVDWIGGDGYSWYPAHANTAPTAMHDIFGDWYAWSAAKGKPLLIGEMGSLPFPGRVAWLKASYQQIRAWTAIRVVLYSQFVGGAATDTGLYDWRVLSTDGTLGEFRHIGGWAWFR
jgi:beta-mannanase